MLVDAPFPGDHPSHSSYIEQGLPTSFQTSFMKILKIDNFSEDGILPGVIYKFSIINFSIKCQ